MAIRVLEEIFFHKHVKDNGDIVDIKIERVEKQKGYEEGIRYSLNYIQNGNNMLRFDNHHGDRHHMHVKGKRRHYEFTDQWALVQDFSDELKKLGIPL